MTVVLKLSRGPITCFKKGIVSFNGFTIVSRGQLVQLSLNTSKSPSLRPDLLLDSFEF
uniref:Uncharacterized protein n=1 Tax=Nelumbo nucifera TaxID=4432 RepID=A0A822Z0K0_NELNU|nr:TPA_asm: hypothetical protein HUJ06_014237 [Nelumbo nucifera]